MNQTLNYYNCNAESFTATTRHVDMTQNQEKFLEMLDPHAYILDFGCGSGRDTKYFLDKGYEVMATDGSSELCRLASEFTGIEVKVMLFQELDEEACFDGIWACSSILHLTRAELLAVMRKMSRALKPGGVIYTSFKYGEFEGFRNERHFTDFTEDTFGEFLKDIPELGIEKHWITGDVRPGREEEKWLNLLLQKK